MLAKIGQLVGCSHAFLGHFSGAGKNLSLLLCESTDDSRRISRMMPSSGLVDRMRYQCGLGNCWQASVLSTPLLTSSAALPGFIRGLSAVVPLYQLVPVYW